MRLPRRVQERAQSLLRQQGQTAQFDQQQVSPSDLQLVEDYRQRGGWQPLSESELKTSLQSMAGRPDCNRRAEERNQIKRVLATPAGHGTTLCSSRRSGRAEFAGHRSVAGDQRDDRATKAENRLKHPVQTMQERGTPDLKALSPSWCRARSALQAC